MTLRFPELVGQDEYDYFEYDVSFEELNEYFDSLPEDELVELAEEAFNRLTEIEQEKFIQKLWEDEYTVEDGKYAINWKVILENDKGFVTDIIVDFEELFEDDLAEFVSDAAYEQHKDALEYGRDPYGYNGVRRSDFF